MIIQLLGANGAGKSTIVEAIINGQPCRPMYFFGRGRPDAYDLPDVLIAGHYEGRACGGADTLPRLKVMDAVKRLEALGPRPVLIEGPTGREPMLAGDVRVVYLRRDPEDCLWHWEQRQRAKGLSINRATMGKRVRACIVRCDRMVAAYHEEGIVTTTTSSREAAHDQILRLIGRAK